MAAAPWSLTAGGVNLVVCLTPRGGREAIDSIETLSDGRAVLKVRVRAVPSKGEANAALVKLIAKAVGVPPRDVSLAAGTNARVKPLTTTGDGPPLLAPLPKNAASPPGSTRPTSSRSCGSW